MNDSSPENQTRPILPAGWQVTVDGMETDDGLAIAGIRFGTNPAGDELLIETYGNVTGQRFGESLSAQVDQAAATAGVTISDPARDRLLQNLEEETRGRQEAAREDFYTKLADGHLYDTLSNDELGPRHPANVADIMRRGPREKPMLIDGWLIADELHWFFAEPGAGKTWIGLWLAKQVIETGQNVLWMDEEVGEDTAAERLLALGADPDLVERHFIYFPYPEWDKDPADLAAWRKLVKMARPALTVIDTATDALAAAGLDENAGVDVTFWVKTFCEPARRVGSAVLVFDHIVKSGSSNSRGYAVGSRAKKAKAKVQLEFRQTEDYDPDTIGRVEVERTKLGVRGSIPKERMLKMGGDGEGNFIIEVTTEPTGKKIKEAATQASKEAGLRDRVSAALRKAGEPLSTSDVRARVTGNNGAITEALAALVESELYPVEVVNTNGKRKGTFFAWTGEPAVGDDGPADAEEDQAA
jgi:hypothetical protein